MEPVSTVLLAGLGSMASYYAAGRIMDAISQPFQTWRDDCQHWHILGEPGHGKSTYTLHLATKALKHHRALFVNDPHGDLARDIMTRCVPEESLRKVVYHRPKTHPLGFNVMQLFDPDDEDEKTTVISDMIELVRHQSRQSIGDVQEGILREVLHKVLSSPKPTLSKAADLLDPTNKTEVGIRARLKKIALTPALAAMMDAPPVPLERIMEQGGVYVLDLGGCHDEVKEVLYALHLCRMKQLIMRGARKPLVVLCDELQMVRHSAGVLAYGIAQFRKFNVSLIAAHQWEGQLEALASSFTAIGNQVFFSLTAQDAKSYKHLWEPRFTWEQLTDLPKYEAVTRLICGGVKANPRRVKTDPPPPLLRLESCITEAIERSYRQYGVGRVTGEANSKRSHGSATHRAAQGSNDSPVAAVLPELHQDGGTIARADGLRAIEAASSADAGELGKRLLSSRTRQAHRGGVA